MSNNSVKELGRFKRTMAAVFGIPYNVTSAEFGAIIPQLNSAGQTVNKETVMSLSAAWACTRLISETISTLPLALYERTDYGRKVAYEHPLYNIIHTSPNTFSTASTFWECNIATMLLHGNSYNRIRKVGGRVVALEFLYPACITFNCDASGNIISLNYFKNYSETEIIPMSDIFFLPAFSLDGKCGLSAIAYGAAVFGNALAANNAANTTFENGLSPTVAFTIDRVLKEGQRTEFKETLQSITGALNAGKSPLLEAGMDARVIGIPPKDAQLLESRLYSVEEVCRWFGVDPSMVGHGGKDSNFGTGLEQKMIGFLTFTLRPWLTRIEQRINKFLLTPTEQIKYYSEFNVDGLMRADSTSRANFYTAMVNNGIFTRDEVRTKENMLRKGGNADKLTVNSATTEINNLSQPNG